MIAAASSYLRDVLIRPGPGCRGGTGLALKCREVRVDLVPSSEGTCGILVGCRAMKRTGIFKIATGIVAIVIFITASPSVSFGYSVLTHEAIIDSAWSHSIEPVLLKRFPAATKQQLRDARAYAYGGAIIQDMGYYPFGSRLFTNLTHYVRSGEFIEALVAESHDLNELAFALGALAHYAADNYGHSIGINRAVPLIYPKLRARFGNDITYVQDPTAHIKAEFAFDVLQVARGRYASEEYHAFIGFKIADGVLARAFYKTYGVELEDIFSNLGLAIGTYRKTASEIIPQMTRVAWESKKDEIEKQRPGVTRDKFVYDLSITEYEKQWGREYQRPGFRSKMLALFFQYLPKVGPLKGLGFRVPTPEAERLFIASFDATIEGYRALLAQVGAGRLSLENRDFDTGRATHAGEYRLADETYADLLRRLEGRNFDGVSPELRQNILAFYRDLNHSSGNGTVGKDWRETLRALDRLRGAQANAIPVTPLKPGTSRQ